MDSLFDILKRKDYDLPPEVVAIKQYVRDEFQAEVEVMMREKDIVIAGRSSALIGSLRMHGPRIKKAAKTDKRIVFRIG
ncbi:hypothetical protein BH09PAT3_BH09PAT3_1460 [soil metagenome]